MQLQIFDFWTNKPENAEPQTPQKPYFYVFSSNILGQIIGAMVRELTVGENGRMVVSKQAIPRP